MIKPPALVRGNRVALVAPAGPVAASRIRRAFERCTDLGYRPVLSEAARLRHGYLAGPDARRADDLQRAFDDPDIDAVWALRGGYGTLRILPHLDLSRMRERPKAFIGFSDNTGVHLALDRAGIVSFHGPHAGFDRFPDWTRRSFERVLGHDVAPGVLESSSSIRPGVLRPGAAEGRLIGGNLSLLAAACGTPYQPDTTGRILLVEDVSEPVYRIDRMLTQLVLSGALDGIAGLAFGRFTKLRPSSEDLPVERILSDVARSADVPAVAHLPFGHVSRNWTLPLGCLARLDADAGTLEILEPAVTAATVDASAAVRDAS